MKWFDDVFLPSLFERSGVNNRLWLTRAQTNICVSNMVRHDVRYDADGYGTKHSASYFSYRWRGRDVRLLYSKKNGCGAIEFYMNEQESDARRKEAEDEASKRRAERIERAKKNPERLARRMDSLVKKLDALRANLSDELSEDAPDEEYITFCTNQITAIENDIQLLHQL